jgi:hypothetical protein
MFKDGQMNEEMFTVKNEVVSWPTVVSDVEQCQKFHVNLHRFHALMSVRISQLGKATTAFAQDGSTNGHGCAQNADNGFILDFLEQYHNDGDKFLSYIIRVTGEKPGIRL